MLSEKMTDKCHSRNWQESDTFIVIERRETLSSAVSQEWWWWSLSVGHDIFMHPFSYLFNLLIIYSFHFYFGPCIHDKSRVLSLVLMNCTFVTSLLHHWSNWLNPPFIHEGCPLTSLLSEFESLWNETCFTLNVNVPWHAMEDNQLTLK